MPDIEHPPHKLPTAHQKISSCLDTDLVTEKEDNDFNNCRTLSDSKRKRGTTNSKEDMDPSCDEICPGPPKKPRMAAPKRKAAASAGNDDNEQPG